MAEGEKKTLRLVARYADRCNLFAVGVDEVGRKLDVLRRHCEDEHRDYHTIDPTLIAPGNPLDDPDRFLAEMGRYAELGFTTVALMPTEDPVDFVHQLGKQIIPGLEALENPR